MLRYENPKTGSLLIIPEEQTLSNLEDDTYILKIMIYNDERIIKNTMTELATVLKEVCNVK